MKVTAVHQFVPMLAPRDAIGAHTLRVRHLLRRLGLHSEIFVAGVHSDLADQVMDYRQFSSKFSDSATWIIYQSSIGSRLASVVAGLDVKKIVNYHSVTPAFLLELWDPKVAVLLAAGRSELKRLAPLSVAGVADSAYNKQEMEDVGYTSCSVAPPLIDMSNFEYAPDEKTLKKLKERDCCLWLFVGRIVPNKAQHDLIKAFSVYRRLYDPNACLALVGGVFLPNYQLALENYAASLGISDAVIFTDSVTSSELSAYYKSADIFVCLSDHEGFCVPLLEAMYNKIPVVAYAQAAVGETVGEGGLLLEKKDPVLVATSVHKILSDKKLRDTLVSSGNAQLDKLSLAQNELRFIDALRHGIGEDFK